MDWILHFDGGCRQNPGGPMTFGYSIRADNEDPLAEGAGRVEGVADPAHRTNNTAELSALLAGLEAALALDYETPSSLLVFGDSQLAVNLVNGRWKARKPHLAELTRKAQGVLAGIRESGVEVTLRWVPRAENARADALASRPQAV